MTHPLSNPLILSWLAFVVYAIAIVAHTLSRALLSVKSDSAIASLRQYVARYLAKLIPQWVLGVALFMLFWNNDSFGGLLQFPAIASKPVQKLGLAIVMGWFSDSVLDQVLAYFHLGGKLAPPPEGPEPEVGKAAPNP